VVRIHYHYSLRNDPEKHNSQLLQTGSLKSHISENNSPDEITMIVQDC